MLLIWLISIPLLIVPIIKIIHMIIKSCTTHGLSYYYAKYYKTNWFIILQSIISKYDITLLNIENKHIIFAIEDHDLINLQNDIENLYKDYVELNNYIRVISSINIMKPQCDIFIKNDLNDITFKSLCVILKLNNINIESVKEDWFNKYNQVRF